jgi:metal transporter CNNM
VAINVLLTLFADSLMAGVTAFVFSTVVITLVGRDSCRKPTSRGMRCGWRRGLAPLLRLYRMLLCAGGLAGGQAARPAGSGREGIPWYREEELHEMLRHHARSEETEVSPVEAIGAINFLMLDDLPVEAEGEPLNPLSIVPVAVRERAAWFSAVSRSRLTTHFSVNSNARGKKWAVVTDEAGEPRFVMDAYEFLRDALFAGDEFDPRAPCHRPLIVRDPRLPLGQVLGRLTVRPEQPGDDVIDEDLILLWTPES